MADIYPDVVLEALEQVRYYLQVEADDDEYRAGGLIDLVDTAISTRREESDL